MVAIYNFQGKIRSVPIFAHARRAPASLAPRRRQSKRHGMPKRNKRADAARLRSYNRKAIFGRNAFTRGAFCRIFVETRFRRGVIFGGGMLQSARTSDVFGRSKHPQQPTLARPSAHDAHDIRIDKNYKIWRAAKRCTRFG